MTTSRRLVSTTTVVARAGHWPEIDLAGGKLTLIVQAERTDRPEDGEWRLIPEIPPGTTSMPMNELRRWHLACRMFPDGKPSYPSSPIDLFVIPPQLSLLVDYAIHWLGTDAWLMTVSVYEVAR